MDASFFFNENSQLLIEKIQPIFDLLQITCLDLDCYQIPIRLVILILKSLSNLKAIRISDSPFYLGMDFDIEDLNHFSSFLHQNQISQITLQNVHRIEQIDFIFHYFSHLKFFALQQIRGQNLESILEYILNSIQQNKIVRTLTICIFCDDVSFDEMTKCLIESNHLVNGCILGCESNRFYIRQL